MRTLRLFLLTTFLVPLVAAAQVDNEPDNNDCSQFADVITLDAPNTAALATNGDVDFFQVQVPAGGGLLVTVTPSAAGAAYSVGIYNSSCQSITSVNGAVSTPASVFTVAYAGTYYVRVARVSGTAPLNYTVEVTVENSGECGSECNNTLATATPLTSLDTTFQARLWGTHTGIAANTNWPINQDQDFYRLETGSCGGVLSVLVTDIPNAITLRVDCYQGTPSNPAGIGSFQRSSCTTGNLSGAYLLDANMTYYLRFYDETNEASQCAQCANTCGNTYNMDPNCFSIDLTFHQDCCEANNTFDTACEVPENTTFMNTLWGTNSQLSAGLPSGFHFSLDQDFYKVVPNGAGVLRVGAAQVPGNLRLILTVFNPAQQSINGVTASANGANVSLTTLLCDEPYYYVRIHEYYNTTIGVNNNPYENSSIPFELSFSFDTEDVCECNNTFTTACEQQVGDTLQFKIYGRSESNYYHPNDRDFFKFTPDECGMMNLSVVSIPPGFTIRARLYSDTTNISIPIAQSGIVTGPNTLSLNHAVIAGQTYYLMLWEDGDNATNAQLMTAIIGFTPANPPLPTITASGPTAICPGSSVTLTSSVATGNVWSTGETTQSIVVSEAGVYSVTTYDSEGCPATSEEPTLVSILPATVADITVVSINGGVVVFANNSSNATQYLWEFGDGSSSTEQNPTHTYAANGEYTVTLTAIGPCGQVTTTQTVTVSSVGVEEHRAARFTLRPNPTSGLVALDLATGVQGHGITLFDATGRVVLSQPIANTSAPITMDLSGHESGVYFVQVRFADGTRAVEQVVKE